MPLRPQGAESHGVYFLHKDVPRGAKNQEREEGMFHVEHKKKRTAGGANVPRGTSPKKSRKENQLKCKAKKKKPDQKRSKKYRPKRRYFYPMRVVARTTPKMKRIKIAVFRAAARVAWRERGAKFTRAARITPRRRLSSRTCPRSVRTGYPATCCRVRGKSCRPACRRLRVCRCRGRRPTR